MQAREREATVTLFRSRARLVTNKAIDNLFKKVKKKVKDLDPSIVYRVLITRGRKLPESKFRLCFFIILLFSVFFVF